MITILSVIAFYISIFAIAKIDELIREKCPKLGIHCNGHFHKVGRVFPMVIWSEFRMGQYKDDGPGTTHPTLSEIHISDL